MRSTPEQRALTQCNRQHRVVQRLRELDAAGASLSSGANRGDWLYACAVLAFGSWGAAVEAAGIDYSTERFRRNQDPDAAGRRAFGNWVAARAAFDEALTAREKPVAGQRRARRPDS